MITEEQVEGAIDWLRKNAKAAAKARAERIYMEEFRKTIKANGMKLHLDKPIGAQEREAYSSTEYQMHLKAMQEAIERDEYARWMMVAEQARIEAWRTQQANQRAEGKAYS